MKRRPKIGYRETVQAFTVEARANGGVSPTSDRQQREYEPPEGYIIIDYKSHTLVKRGNSTYNEGTQPSGYRIINTDDIKGSLDAKVEWRYAKVWAKGTLDSKWNNIRTQVQEYQNLRRRIVGTASAKGEFAGAGAHIQVKVEAIIEYVGTPDDAYQYANLILGDFSSDGDIKYLSGDWKSSKSNTVIDKKKNSNKEWDYNVYITNTDSSSLDNTIYYSTSSKKAGIYKFKPSLKTQGSSRKAVIRIQEDLDGKVLGKNEKEIILSTNNTAYEITYTKQRSDTSLFYIIKWSDGSRSQIILDGNYTFVKIAK